MKAPSLAAPASFRRAGLSGRARRAVEYPDLLIPSWWEIAALFVLVLIYTASLSLGSGPIAIVNLLGPVALIVIVGASAATMVVRRSTAVWSPLLWVRVALLVYYGAGSIVPLLAGEDTRELIDSFYQAFPEDVAKLNLVCAFFAFSLFGCSAAFNGMIAARRSRDHTATMATFKPSALDMRVIGTAFLLTGTLFNYFYVVPHAFGFIIGTSSQIFLQLALLSNVGYYILTLWCLRNGSQFVYLILALVALESFFALMMFQKSAALLPLIVAGIAFIQYRATPLRLAIAFGGVSLFYFTIAPIVTYSRTVVGQTYGSIVVTASPTERLAIVSSYTPERAAALSQTNAKGAWARLSYTNAGTYAVNQYDNGFPGNSLTNIWVVFIPRFIYPDKPIITDIGVQFSEGINGNSYSSVSPGIPAELYWNGGFPFVFLGGIYVAVLLSAISIYSMNVMLNSTWYLMPVVLLGLRLAIRMDGFLVPDFVGPLTVIVAAHVALNFLNSLMLKKK